MDSSLWVGAALLQQKRLQVILEPLTRQQKIDRSLIFSKRTPITPVVTDDEMIGEFDGEIYAADIITDDQQAVTYDYGQFNFTEQRIANMKVGFQMGQKQLNELKNVMASDGPEGKFAAAWMTRRMLNLALGIQMRLEALIVSCYRDNTVYDRYGIKVTGTWGTPADLKLVVDTPWNEHDDATPVADLQLMLNEIGPDYTALFVDNCVVSMSRKAFGHMVSCKEFQNKAKIIPNIDFNMNVLWPDGSLPNAYDPRIARMAEAVVGCAFEMYDAQITEKLKNGKKKKTRILPHNELLFSGPAVWNNPTVIDVANGIVTESLLSGLVGSSAIGGIPANARGPITYATPQNINMNPPGIEAWGVQRAFPRKFDKNATALMDIGIDPETGE